MNRHAAGLLVLLAILCLGGCPCPPKMVNAPPQHARMAPPAPGVMVAYTLAPSAVP